MIYFVTDKKKKKNVFPEKLIFLAAKMRFA